MTLFDHRRISHHKIKLDVNGLRQGFYSDKYFENVVRVLEGARTAGYHFAGRSIHPLPAHIGNISTGDLVVEAQYFNRRAPFALVAGIDAALAILRAATGCFEGKKFVETWDQLEVRAVEDGILTHYGGDPMNVETVIEVRGRYRDFALLETPMLGVMTRASRIATNVYNLLQVSNRKPILFFPARFDLPEVQSIDGYAYWVAVQRYNGENGYQVPAIISTDAQGAWWGGRGGGTVPHALIACFLADTAEAMEAYARYVPPHVPRIALVDFNNNTVRDSLATINTFWPHYRAALETGDAEAQKRWALNGVRLDTSKNTRDESLGPDDPYGVNPKLVRVVREALNNAWQNWDVPLYLMDEAQNYCQNVQIVVSGGFDRARIQEYEQAGVPVDAYGVGSRFFQNDSDTNTDYTMDIVRLQLGGQWVDMAKVGRQPCDNPNLQPVDLKTWE
jgi:nicotinate phosphoribosyltransferase